MQNLISFSTDFKGQYSNRDKDTKKEIKDIGKQLVELFKFTTKNKICFKKMKLRMSLKTTNEIVNVVIFPSPRIVFKRIQ